MKISGFLHCTNCKYYKLKIKNNLRQLEKKFRIKLYKLCKLLILLSSLRRTRANIGDNYRMLDSTEIYVYIVSYL